MKVMGTVEDELLEQALALPKASRLRLADALHRSVEATDDLSPEWKAEIAARLQRLRSDDVEPLDAQESLRELRQKLSR